MHGRAEFVRELLKLKPDLATRLDKGRFSTIHITSANRFEETVRELLKFSRELTLLKSSDGRTSLHCAAVTGKVQVLKELFSFRPNSIGEVTVKSETAFHLAVKYNQFDVFKAMVDLSKNMRNIKDILNAGDEDGNAVLHLAVARKQTQVNNAIFYSTRDIYVAFNIHFHTAFPLLMRSCSSLSLIMLIEDWLAPKISMKMFS
jgi:hypothetical protein